MRQRPVDAGAAEDEDENGQAGGGEDDVEEGRGAQAASERRRRGTPAAAPAAGLEGVGEGRELPGRLDPAGHQRMGRAGPKGASTRRHGTTTTGLARRVSIVVAAASGTELTTFCVGFTRF